MRIPVLSGLAVLIFTSFGIAPPASAKWVRIAIVTLKAPDNVLPGGHYVNGGCGPGVCRYSVDGKSPGISYHSNPLSKPKVGAFVMLLDNAGSNPNYPPGKYNSFGLNILPGPSSVTVASAAGGGTLYFLFDRNGSDTTGSVTLFVDQWK